MVIKTSLMSRCSECKGTGLVKKISIQHCCDLGCYRCENSRALGLYEECSTCWATGTKHTTINGNEKTYDIFSIKRFQKDSQKVRMSSNTE